MSRNTYNLSNLIHAAGHIGRLQTLQIIPCVAGESVQFDLEGIFRLAPTRKEIVSECQIDVCGFYVPHRHIYGDDWVSWLNEGPDSTVAFPAGVAIPPEVNNAVYLCINNSNPTIPLHTIEGYNRIFQRYFAVPNTGATGQDDQTFFTDLDYYPLTVNDNHNRYRYYGKTAARLPHILNGMTPVDNDITAAGFTLDLNADDATVTDLPGDASFDIRDLKLIQSRFQSETETTYFAAWYNDLLQTKWGTTVNIDADQRPEFLFRETMYVSGQDVNGTDDATLGSYIGKTLAPIQMRMRRKVFMEHGMLWIMALPRYPLVHCDEVHPILQQQFGGANYDYITADPVRYKALQPIPFTPARYLSNSPVFTPSATLMEPYGQHYRYQTNRVHPHFRDIPGYPFAKFNPATEDTWYYYADNEYFDTFQTTQLAQWQMHLRMKCEKFSNVPGPLSSIFVGAN